MSDVKEPSTASPDWATLEDEALLERRISDLGLRIAGTELEGRIQRLYAELDERKIAFHPPCYLADEWFCPEGVPAIALPFYLAHPRLKKLEEKMILEIEGGTDAWGLQLLRHEAGHALNHAYRLSKRTRWQRLFGPPSTKYPDTYRPRPYSRSFVRHLEDWYAQSHPDEDFAETFAVWLTPGLPWREQYRGWKALKKLEYVDQLMREIAGHPPLVTSGARECAVWTLRMKLRTYYKRKRKEFGHDYADVHDADLKRLFSDDPGLRANERASHFMRRHQRALLNTVAFWTEERKFTVNRLLRDLTDRCDQLGLRLKTDGADALMPIAVYLATLTTNYRITGKFQKAP